MVAAVAVVVAVVVSVGGGAAVEDVERDVAGRWAEHHQAALAQWRIVTMVTEGTLLQTAWRGTPADTRTEREVVHNESRFN